MSSTEFEVSEEAVTAFVNFCTEIFDSLFIRDMELRRKMCREYLRSSHFIDDTSEKYDILTLLEGVSGQSKDSDDSAFKNSVNIPCTLTSAQKALLTNNNMDLNIRYLDKGPQPHALAYAQRVVDLARLKNSINHRNVVIDFGGNYATHAHSGAVRIHSCTLLRGTEEFHRQTQRDVNLELGGYQEVSKCVDGIEACDVMALESFSLHTLTRFDPEKIPHVFLRHGLEYMTGLHHYDPSMDTQTSGFMADVEMHWRITDDDQVRFYFDGDSSHDYVHPYSWLQVYSRNRVFDNPEYSFVVYYTVDRIQAGNLYWSMRRLSKETLSSQMLQPEYRYQSNEVNLVINVPEFSPELGRSIDDPRAYRTVPVSVPADLFSHVYRAGMANDTSRPDTPLSLDDIRNTAHSYNYVRGINGTSITTTYRLSSEQIDKIALGVYLLVVQKSSSMKGVTHEYTSMFKRLQKRWGDENFLVLATKCFSQAAILPFVLLAQDFNDAVDLFAVHMRSKISGSSQLASVNKELPYYLVSPARVVQGDARLAFENGPRIVEDNIDFADDQEIDLAHFYEVFKDQVPEDVKQRIERKLELQDKTDPALVTAVSGNEILPDIQEDRESWERAIEFLDKSVDGTSVGAHEVVPQSQVMEHVIYRVYEAAAYNFDVAMNVIEAARSRCSETWTGTGFRASVISSRNNTADLGIKYLKVTNGQIPEEVLGEYALAIDPMTMDKVYLPQKGQTTAKIDTISPYLFVFSAFKIFNGITIGRNLVTLARTTKEVKKCKYTLVDGIPGCGKTYEIINTFKDKHLVACAVRETANRTRDRLLEKHPFLSKDRVRSVDSCVMHGCPRSTIVMMDEGLMLIPGAADYVVQKSRASELRVYGDSAQIGFIDRGSKLGILKFPSMTLWEAIEYRNESYRIPGDICALIRRFYSPERRPKIKTYSNVRRSVSAKFIPEIDAPCYTVSEPGVMVMTLTVMDKEKISVKPGFVDAKHVSSDAVGNRSTVLTIHEAQGTDVPHVSVRRLTTFQNPIFDSHPHQLVAFTRHTHTFELCSTVDGDPYMNLAKAAMELSEEEIDCCMLPTPKELLKKFEKVKPRGVVSN